VITPLRFIFLIVLVGTTIEVLTKKTRNEIRTTRWRQRVEDHTVIVGFGVKGRSAARMLLESGMSPLSIVVVSMDKTAVQDANRMGLAGVLGDARREDVLRDAATERASKIIVATDEDDTSVLVTLTARRLAPKAEIVAAAREAANAQILRQSGASSVIPTAESAGHLMALSLLSPVAGTLMEDLLDSGRGLEVIQRDITKEELGVSPTEVDATGQIVLAVIRDDVVHRFDTSDIRILQKGDQLVVIRHTESNGYSVTPPPAS
jgi:voltage-gated potassium channel